eukprot:1716241-Karenia_brevis.AAC.1
MVLPKAEQELRMTELGLRRPYNDSSLRSRRQYVDLVNILFSRNMIEFATSDGVRIGIFAVWKSDNVHQRLIIDARLSNCCFREPESPDLPTGGSLARLRTDSSHTIFSSSCDLKDAFYTIALPESLRPFFTMDPILAKHLNHSNIKNLNIGPDTLVYPRLTVVPMGWSHAVNVCQFMVTNLVCRSGMVDDSLLISDSRPIPDLKAGAVMCYVDNVI